MLCFVSFLQGANILPKCILLTNKFVSGSSVSSILPNKRKCEKKKKFHQNKQNINKNLALNNPKNKEGSIKQPNHVYMVDLH